MWTMKGTKDHECESDTDKVEANFVEKQNLQQGNGNDDDNDDNGDDADDNDDDNDDDYEDSFMLIPKHVKKKLPITLKCPNMIRTKNHVCCLTKSIKQRLNNMMMVMTMIRQFEHSADDIWGMLCQK